MLLLLSWGAPPPDSWPSAAPATRALPSTGLWPPGLLAGSDCSQTLPEWGCLDRGCPHLWRGLGSGWLRCQGLAGALEVSFHCSSSQVCIGVHSAEPDSRARQRTILGVESRKVSGQSFFYGSNSQRARRSVSIFIGREIQSPQLCWRPRP